MTLYYSIVFALLAFEIFLFGLLIADLPFGWKSKLFTFLAENPIVSKIQYGLKITFIFITILWIDSINRVYRVHAELAQAKQQGGVAAVAGSERLEVQARRFYSERNMYLTGFTLFLSLVLNRTYTMILESLRLQAELLELKGEKPASDKTSSKLGEAGDLGEISRLKEELRKRDQDIEVLKSQSKGLSDEYNRLGDQFHISDGTPKKKV